MRAIVPYSENSYWKPGDCIVMRGICRGQLWWVCPQYVVLDTPELVALYWCAGTPVHRWYRRPTVQDVLASAPQLIDSCWTDTNVLSLVVPGASHSVDVMWDSKRHDLRCWYIQLQEPLRRTPVGFDTMDQILDIVISPDRKEWHWKDEDEFAEAIQVGLYSAEQALAIRKEGEGVIEKVKTNRSPFCDGWERWKPEAHWGIPQFPFGWEDLPS